MRHIIQTLAQIVHRLHAAFLRGLSTMSVTTMYVAATLGLVTLGGISAVLADNSMTGGSSEDEAIGESFMMQKQKDEQEADVQNDSSNNQTLPNEVPEKPGSATNESTTTVTVNGETVIVQDNQSYEKSYTTRTDSGSTQVDVSIHNRSQSSEDTSTQTEMQRGRVHVRSENRRTALDP